MGAKTAQIFNRIPQSLSLHTMSRKRTSPSSDMAVFKEVLSNSKNIIAVAGAGLSAASGA